MYIYMYIYMYVIIVLIEIILNKYYIIILMY